MDLFEILSSSSSESSSSDEDLEILLKAEAVESLQVHKNNENFMGETVSQFTDQIFMQHFRLSRPTAVLLSKEFETSNFYAIINTGISRVSAFKCLLAFLWYAANEGASYRVVADKFNLTISKLNDIIKNVTLFLSGKSPKVIVWPSREECAQISAEFAKMGFVGAIGCIDGAHIRIDAPSDDPEYYLNRNKYYSLQLQVVCDSRKRIRDVFIGYPGSVHDGRVFRSSSLGKNLQAKCEQYFLLGDSAYPCLRNLLTPYKDLGNLTSAQRMYNKKLSHCRKLIEHTIGLLKQRFKQLYHLKFKEVVFMNHFIRACCVLHNICKDDELQECDLPIYEPVDDEAEEVDDVGINYRNYITAMLNI